MFTWVPTLQSGDVTCQLQDFNVECGSNAHVFGVLLLIGVLLLEFLVARLPKNKGQARRLTPDAVYVLLFCVLAHLRRFRGLCFVGVVVLILLFWRKLRKYGHSEESEQG